MDRIDRPALIDSVRSALARSRAVVLAGPRQSGKSTLAQTFLPQTSPRYFDLENPLHESRLTQPMDTLSRLQGLVVIDEVQRRPGLFPVLRVLIDRSDAPGQYLLLGSASPSCCGRPVSRCSVAWRWSRLPASISARSLQQTALRTGRPIPPRR